MVYPALQAAEIVKDEGIDATVINPRFVKPIDEKLILHHGRRTRALLTVEDHVAHGGFGSAVVELLADHEGTEITVLRHALPDDIIEHGAQNLLCRDFGLDAAGIADKIRQLYAMRHRQDATSFQ